MDPDIVYTKTAKGFDEVRWRRHKLPARLRALLITIDGRSNAATLVRSFASPAQAAAGLAGLLACGYIEIVASPAAGTPVDVLFSARQFMALRLRQALGGEGEYLAASIDAAVSREALADLASESLAVLRARGEAGEAAAFASALRQFGISESGSWQPPEDPPPAAAGG